jgi:small-conductance mechanosensitive channel
VRNRRIKAAWITSVPPLFLSILLAFPLRANAADSGSNATADNPAAGHPGVAKEPSPQVYVVNFTAGAVTFQVRAWTDRYQGWAQLRSDLAVEVNDALAREKIAIA